MKFSALLKENRIERGLSQAAVAKAVNRDLGIGESEREGLSQTTYSAWESGRQMPSLAKKRHVEALAKVLAIDSSLLLEAASIADTETALSADFQFMKDVNEWTCKASALSQFTSDKPTIWLLSPQILAGFYDVSGYVVGLWEHNLNLGIDFRIIWHAEEIKHPDHFEKFIAFLNRLPTQHRNGSKSGTISNFLVCSDYHDSPKCEGLQKSRDHFEKAGTALSPQYIEFCDATLLTCSDSEWIDKVGTVLRQLAFFVSARVAVLVANNDLIDPLANVLIASTSENPSGEIENCYRWLGKQKTMELFELVSRIDYWIKENLSKQSGIDKVA